MNTICHRFQFVRQFGNRTSLYILTVFVSFSVFDKFASIVPTIFSIDMGNYFPTLYCTFLGAPASTILPTSAKPSNKNSR